MDVYVMPGAQDVCYLGGGTTGSINGAGYRCVDPNAGKAFPPDQQTSAAIAIGRSDQVQGGFAHGPFNIQASFDYALNMNMLVGARAGYEALTMPTPTGLTASFPPVHLEARFTYLFGKDALQAKVAPMAFVAAGAGEFDAMVPVQVFLNTSGGVLGPGKENAWITAGPVFAAGGGGVRLLLGKKLAATGALKLQGAFGGQAGFLFGVVPEAGIQLGF
jgi:hypothetical protein